MRQPKGHSVFVIRYELFVGETEGYAASAAAALRLIGDIGEASGVIRGVETVQNQPIDLPALQRRAALERAMEPTAFRKVH